MSHFLAETSSHNASPYLLALRQAGRGGQRQTITRIALGELDVEFCSTAHSLWALIRRRGKGGLALRVAYIPALTFACDMAEAAPGETARLTVASAIGQHLIIFRAGGLALDHLRVTVRFKPTVPLLIPFMPRDLYPLGADDGPLAATGRVEASQRGLNAGLLYFHIDEPDFGNVLYFQNLTALSEYYRATKTTPDKAVGGLWPELGHLLPTPPQNGIPSPNPLPAGQEVTLSDAILVFRRDVPAGERASARQFLQMLGVAYKMLDLPPAGYRDWVDRAERTARDLDTAPEATIEHYGHRYIHPYTAAEYPDIMVQMSIIAALHDWGKWRGEPHPLEAEFKAGLEKFYDPELKTLRRYLPNVGDDKNADAVDSWYLYHPMLNLGILALDGDGYARDLLMRSIDFGIKAAHHFKYKWPIQYDVRDFSVITETAEADGRGQTDVGGIYPDSSREFFRLGKSVEFDLRRRVGDAIFRVRVSRKTETKPRIDIIPQKTTKGRKSCWAWAYLIHPFDRALRSGGRFSFAGSRGSQGEAMARQAVKKMCWTGQASGMEIRIRRTEVITRAPIFSSFCRMVWGAALARSVACNAMRRSCVIST